MKLYLDRLGTLRIKDQIKRQIRVLIEAGELSSGQLLPSAKDMARTLSVNRNTVSNAYRELVVEGYLDAVVGKGTFVKDKPIVIPIDDLAAIFDQALEKAVKRGFTKDMIEDFLLTRLTSYFSEVQGGRLLVVECNREAVENISLTLQSELGVETVGLLIQEIETNPEIVSQDVLSSVDLVVCGVNHVEEFQKVCADSTVEIVAVMTRADVRIVNELTRLPPGTKVGFCCANQQSTETFFKESMLSGGVGLIKIWAGLDNRDDLMDLLHQCQVIIANDHVYEEIVEMADPKQRVIRLQSNIDRANVDLIRERLTRARIIRRRPSQVLTKNLHEPA
jgi:GntR family transcriptional regulator